MGEIHDDGVELHDTLLLRDKQRPASAMLIIEAEATAFGLSLNILSAISENPCDLRHSKFRYQQYPPDRGGGRGGIIEIMEHSASSDRALRARLPSAEDL
jgi:hypothetical protein